MADTGLDEKWLCPGFVSIAISTGEARWLATVA